MSDPVRLRDGGGTSPEARELLRSATPATAIPAGMHEELAVRVDRVALAHKGAAHPWAKILVGGSALGVAVIVAIASVRPHTVEHPWPRHPVEAPRGSTRDVQAPATLSAPVVMSPPALVALPTASTTARSVARPSAPANDLRSEPQRHRTSQTAPTDDTPPHVPFDVRERASGSGGSAADQSVARQVQLVEQARAVLDDSPGTALARVDGYQRTFPNGMLLEESEVVAVDALIRLGRLDDARARGEAMIARTPRGLYVERVRALLRRAP